MLSLSELASSDDVEEDIDALPGGNVVCVTVRCTVLILAEFGLVFPPEEFLGSVEAELIRGGSLIDPEMMVAVVDHMVALTVEAE